MSTSYAEWARQVDAMLPRKVKNHEQEEPELFNQPFAEEQKLEEETAKRRPGGWNKRNSQYIRKGTAVKICGIPNKAFNTIYESQGFDAPVRPDGYLGKCYYIKRSDFEQILKLFKK